MEPSENGTRSKVFLTVTQQQVLLNAGDFDGMVGKGRALSALVLSTGVHPSVLSLPEEHAVELAECYWSWRRAKTAKPVVGAWSPWLLRTEAVPVIKALLGKSPQWLSGLIAAAGAHAGIPGRVAFNRLRHTYFVNLARLGVDPWTISNMAGTDLNPVGRYYTVGMMERRRLEPAQVEWLQLVMGV